MNNPNPERVYNAAVSGTIDHRNVLALVTVRALNATQGRTIAQIEAKRKFGLDNPKTEVIEEAQ